MKVFFGEIQVVIWMQIIYYVFFYGLNSVGNLLWHHPFVNMTISVISICLILYLYGTIWTKKIISVFLIYGVCFLFDLIVATLVGDHIIGQVFELVNHIMFYLLLFLIEVAAEYCMRLRDDRNIFKKRGMEAVGVFGFSMFILGILVINKIQKEKIVVIVAIGILYTNLFVFVLLDAIAKEYETQEKNLILERRIAEYQNQIELMEQEWKKMGSFRHDFEHHIRALKELAKSGDRDRIMKYLTNMSEFIYCKKDYVQTGNREIDSIVNYFIKKAKDAGITVGCNIKIPMQMKLDFYDINIILSNLLENAIEAAVHAENRSINLEMELEKEILYIEVENSCSQRVEILADGMVRTTKQEKEGHGFGILNMKAILHKYHGEMEMKEKGGYFYVNILLYLFVENME